MAAPEPNLPLLLDKLQKLLDLFDACSQLITDVEWMPESQPIATKLRLMKLDIKRASSSLQEMVNTLAVQMESQPKTGGNLFTK